MGQAEEESRKRSRNHNLQRIILETVATAGILSAALVAPNALQSLRRSGFLLKIRQKEIINLSRYRLVQNGLLARNERGFLQLTPKGETKLQQYELHDYKISKPKKWDKKWRMLIFDVREERKSLRDKIRRTLIAIGFERLQYSVWVYPYDCEDLVTLLKADFKIGKDLLYIISDSIENDTWLKKRFNLI
jgi:CRISPR/Cas system-associated endoribonuclease Cas2